MRSWLFVPANAGDKVRKALLSAADAVIIDLEDSVPGEEKDSARDTALRAAAEMAGETKAAVYLRVNERGSQWFGADIAVAASGAFAGVILPKTESAQDVTAADEALKAAEKAAGCSAPLDLVPLLESAAGVLNAREIAAACPRVRRLTFGVVDFLLDMGGRQSPEGNESLFAMSYIALASRAAGLEQPIDTVWSAFRDTEGMERACEKARNIGYQGKLLIHPAQIEPANRIFSPGGEEISFAQKVVLGYEAALAEGKAAIKVEGRMVDLPVYRHAKTVLAAAERYGLSGGGEV